MTQLRDLDDQELLGLIGLLKAVVRADHELSPEEHVELKRVAAEVGPDRFHQGTAQAEKTFKRLSDVKAHVQQITRPTARDLIFQRLRLVAEADGTVQQEQELLQWLAGIWGISAS